MPRKAFIQDFGALQVKDAINSIADFRRGDDDGSFVFTFSPPGSSAAGIQITGFVPELSDYPESHSYVIYAISEDAPSWATSVLEDIQKRSSKQPLRWLLENIAASLTKAGAISTPEDSLDSEMEDSGMENFDDDDDYGDGDESDNDTLSVGGWEREDSPSRTPDAGGDIEMGDLGDPLAANENRERLTAKLKADLEQAQGAGFKVGVQGDFKGGADLYVSLSIRISRLGISDAAINAWDLEPTNYLILLIHYSNYYQDLAKLTTEHHVRRSVTMCVGTSDHYKLTHSECVRALSKTKNLGPRGQAVSSNQGDPETSANKEKKESSLIGMFISRPLNDLLKLRLVPVLEYRLRFGLGWDGAEMLFTDLNTRDSSDCDCSDEKYYQTPEPKTGLAPIVASDALLGTSKGKESISFPLLAMQFTLRHLVQCTEFCLICHTKIISNFEALKPYVCSSPLCLYQYMTLGFGPSIEYEILSQPTVVDLLVSFCYLSASAGRLKEYPVGMNLLIPSEASIQVSYSISTNELLFEDSLSLNASLGLAVGRWVKVRGCLYGPNHPEDIHLKVLDMSGYPVVKVSTPVRDDRATRQAGVPSDAVDPDTSQLIDPAPGSCSIYSTQFDTCGDKEKRDAILSIIDTFPSVLEMRTWLQRYSKVGEEASLKNWAERISPTALGVLRWIIASNRSCIIPVDQFLDQEGNVAPAPKGKKKGSDRRIPGVDGWLQFRFAMGSPDKEQRFVSCVRDAQKRLNLAYPTLFAFHGSPLPNWHSIIREGLHFQEVAHGRAYGNGCYHSLDLRTSMGYCPPMTSYSGGNLAPGAWRHSILNIQSAISLNEIVNAPGEFVSKSPHLVIAQVDWIQTRYLFVQTEASKGSGARDQLEPLAQAHPQDPNYTPFVLNRKLEIPSLASAHLGRPPTPPVDPLPLRRPRGVATRQQSSKKKGTSTKAVGNTTGKTKNDLAPVAQTIANAGNTKRGDDTLGDDGSDTTETTDIRELFSDDEDANPRSADPSPLGFEPGTLDTTDIIFLRPPTYASNLATRRLTNDLSNLIKLQQSHPLPDLGFYIDPERVDNVYQWLVELHSFPPTLPLAQDMERTGVKSVVLEIRFGPSYPMSPPFVRVVKPRFKGFAQGGGGHITAGGALCMELLTNSGWSAVSSVESVLVQVRMAICADDPPARLEVTGGRSSLAGGGGGCYGVGEAREAYVRACRAHGWGIPDDFQRMA